MTRDECRRILGPEASARFEAIAAAAPPPSPELLALMRRVFAQPATSSRQAAGHRTAA